MLRRIKTELQVGGGNQKTKTITRNKKTLVRHDELPSSRHDFAHRLCSRVEPSALRAPIVIMDNDVVYCSRCKLLNDVFIASMACSNCLQCDRRGCYCRGLLSVHSPHFTHHTSLTSDALHVSLAVLFVRVLFVFVCAALSSECSIRAAEQ